MNTQDETKQNYLAVWGPWVAMAAAVVLTAKGEFDLAVLAHFTPKIAWMFPVMVDVYVITAFHRRRWKDMIISALLMVFCQIAVHLLPVYITAGEQTPWGLVVAVACIAPIVVVRVKMLTGRTAAEIAAGQQAAQRQEELHAAQVEIAAVRAQLVQVQAAAGQETARAQQAITARAEVENRASAAAAEQEDAVGKQQEILARAQEEIERLREALDDAVRARQESLRHAAEQDQAAGAAQGRLAEARDAAERAVTAKAAAEERAQAHTRQVSTAAEQAEHGLREQLAAAAGAAAAAERSAAQLADRVRVLEAQREEARTTAERAATTRVLAEQEIADLQRGRDAAFDELEKVRRQLARATEKTQLAASRQVEIANRREAETSSRPQRKNALPVPVELPDFLPVVDGVRQETVAVVLVAKAIEPRATYAELHEITGISTRTVGTVLRGVPEETAIAVGQQLLALAGGGKVLALTEGRAA